MGIGILSRLRSISRGNVASPAPQNPYASQQSFQSQYALPLAGLGAIFNSFQQPNPYAALFQQRYVQPTRLTPAAFVPQSAKDYISPFGSQREQTYFDRTQTAPTPVPAPAPAPAPTPPPYENPMPWRTGGVIKAATGRYLQGPGDGTSDSIPATIGNAQPARLADGEFVIDARTVSEIGNGSSNAGAKKLYAMMERVHRERKKAKRGQDSNADRFLPR